MADVENWDGVSTGWHKRLTGTLRCLLSFSFLTFASCGSIVFSGSLGVSTAISSSLAAALPPLFVPVVLLLAALAEPVVAFLVSAVAGVLGVVSLSLVAALGVLTGYLC